MSLFFPKALTKAYLYREKLRNDHCCEILVRWETVKLFSCTGLSMTFFALNMFVLLISFLPDVQGGAWRSG